MLPLLKLSCHVTQSCIRPDDGLDPPLDDDSADEDEVELLETPEVSECGADPSCNATASVSLLRPPRAKVGSPYPVVRSLGVSGLHSSHPCIVLSLQSSLATLDDRVSVGGITVLVV